jgi:hypothetical protein
MGKGLIFGLGILGLLLFSIIGVVMYVVNIKDTENQLRKLAMAKHDESKLHHANMWGILKDKAGVSESYKESFEKITVQMMDARYGNDQNLLFKFITESNPNFDTSLMKDLMESIEVERTGFMNAQKRFIDIRTQHELYISSTFNSIILGFFGVQSIDLKIVTSSSTEKSFNSGIDDETLYEKKSQIVAPETDSIK